MQIKSRPRRSRVWLFDRSVDRVVVEGHPLGRIFHEHAHMRTKGLGVHLMTNLLLKVVQIGIAVQEDPNGDHDDEILSAQRMFGSDHRSSDDVSVFPSVDEFLATAQNRLFVEKSVAAFGLHRKAYAIAVIHHSSFLDPSDEFHPEKDAEPAIAGEAVPFAIEVDLVEFDALDLEEPPFSLLDFGSAEIENTEDSHG